MDTEVIIAAIKARHGGMEQAAAEQCMAVWDALSPDDKVSYLWDNVIQEPMDSRTQEPMDSRTQEPMDSRTQELKNARTQE